MFDGCTSCEAEVNCRIGLAMGAMKALDKSVSRSRYLSRRTKVRLFESLVMPVLLYSFEAWTLTADLRRRLNTGLVRDNLSPSYTLLPLARSRVEPGNAEKGGNEQSHLLDTGASTALLWPRGTFPNG